MTDYCNKKVGASYKMGIETVGGNIYFDEKGFTFRPQTFNVQIKEVRVDYIDIMRVSVKNTWCVIPNGITVIQTKGYQGYEHKFIVQHRNDVASFLERKIEEFADRRAVKLAAFNIGIELDDTTLTIMDEVEGMDVQFEILDLLQYKNRKFIVLLPSGNEEEDEIVILEIEKGSASEQVYVSVDDEDTLEAVIELFQKRFEAALKDY